MRKPFIQTLTKLAEKNPKIILMIGDVGFSFLEEFKERFPNQFINGGIAEQNLLSMASGFAREGWIPVIYTMANFILLRPHEQLRNDICFTNDNVKLFAVHGGPSYSFLGMSHNLFEGEEEAILGTLPNIKTFFPKTEEETVSMMLEDFGRKGPSYFSI